MSAEHTPTPWAFEPRDKINGSDVERPWIGQLQNDDYSALVCGTNADVAWANATLIVRAVNNHDALIELAHQYASDLRHPPTADSCERRLERIAAVLAKAGAA